MEIRQHTVDTPYMVGPVHFYSTEVKGEILLFDTGPPTSRAKKYLQENIDLQRLRYVFLTHCHIDHCGLARWLQDETGAQVFLPYRDSLKILSHDERLRDMYSLLEGVGFNGGYLDELHQTLSSGKIFPPYPRHFDIVEDGLPQHLGLTFLSCPGHSQSDLVFCSDDWAITGDVLLKGVFQSPLLDVDLETGERFNNYHAYCSTLKKLSGLRQKKVCPGHRKNIDSVDATILFYIGRMLDRVIPLKAFAESTDVAEIIERMFNGGLVEPFHIYLKASEILFMQDFLDQPQRLRSSLETIGLFDAVAGKYDLAVMPEDETT